MNAKTILLAVFTVGLGVLNGYLWERTMLAGDIGRVSIYSLPVTALIVFGACFGIAALFIRHRGLRWATGGVAVGAGYLFVPYSHTVLTALVLSVAAGAWATRDIAREQTQIIRFDVRKVFKSGLGLFFTAMALMLATFYLTTSTTGDKAHFLIPRQAFDAVMPIIRGVTSSVVRQAPAGSSFDPFISGLFTIATNPNLTIDELIVSQASNNPEFQNLNEEQRTGLVAEGRRILSEQFGIPLTGSEKLGDILWQTTNKQLERFAGPWQGYLPFIAALGFFIVAKTLTIPMYLVTLLVIAGVIQLLKISGLVRTTKQMVEVQRLEMK